MTDALVSQALELHQTHFPSAFPPTICAAAPGRVNLIGEHTDYNEGYVFPMALEHRTVVVGGRNETAGANSYECVSQSVSGDLVRLPCGEKALREALVSGWANYVKGVIAQFDCEVPPFTAAVTTNIPIGGGLSSSAALLVALYTFVEQLLGAEPVSDIVKAKACQRAEHEYAGVPCGIMDQAISVMGRQGHALVLDCRTLETGLVPLGNCVVLVCNTNVCHSLSGSPYKVRRLQCEAGVKILQTEFPSIKALRDATIQQLNSVRDKLDAYRAPDHVMSLIGSETDAFSGDILYRRCRHVITECQRTLEAVKALSARDFHWFGRLMLASHDSLRIDYNVSCTELDICVDAIRPLTQDKDGGVYGTRMTGGGFGGCCVVLAHASAIATVTRTLMHALPSATCFATRPSVGAQCISLDPSDS